jgi:asparagine synthase (glutamine-hydrolysing)
LRSRGADFDLRAYTVVFDRLADEEEGRYADLVAARIGVPVERLVGDDYWMRPPHGNVTWAFPEPGAIPNQSPVYDIGRRASAFARGLLTGLGGDPLFHAGVSWPSGSAQWRDRAGFAWLALRQGRLPRYGVRTALRRRLRGGRVQVSPLPDWIEPEFARRWDLEARWRQVHIEWDGVRDHRAMLHPTWAAIFARAHPGAQGVPVRVLFPFFDLRLAQYVWETPPYPWRQDKRLLRDAMRGRLPESVLRRPKTLLYDPKGRAHTDDPRYRVAVLPEAQRWRLELMSEPAIREYVHVERARALIESPAPKTTLPFVENSFTLAYWLKFGFDTSHRHPTSKETPHAADPAAA